MINSKKVLLIEDDANLLYGLQAKLRVEGFEIATDQGLDEDILNKIISIKPDYIILDLILPKINGLTLLKEIRGKSLIAKIPVFIFTNISDKDSQEQAKKFGANIYLLKTDFNLDEFVLKFKKILANKEKYENN